MPDRKICQFDYYWNFIHEMICNKVNVQGVKSLWGDCNVFPPVSVSGALYRKNTAIAPKWFNSLDTNLTMNKTKTFSKLIQSQSFRARTDYCFLKSPKNILMHQMDNLGT